MIITIIEITLAVVCGFLAGPAAVYVFNLIPYHWLCDYGENPVERGNAVAKARQLTPEEAELITRSLVDPDYKRIKENPWRWVFAAGFLCLCLWQVMQGMLGNGIGGDMVGPQAAGSVQTTQFMLAALVCCWGLLMIALADLKYMIIPDQLLILPAVAGAGFLPANLALVKSDKLAIMTEIKEKLLDRFEISDGAMAAVYIISGVAIGIILMLLVAGLGRLICGSSAGTSPSDVSPALGGGDIKLYAVLGFCLGAAGVLFVFLLSSLTAGVDSGLALAKRKAQRSSQRPLGPHICAAAAIYIFAIWPLII